MITSLGGSASASAAGARASAASRQTSRRAAVGGDRRIGASSLAASPGARAVIIASMRAAAALLALALAALAGCGGGQQAPSPRELTLAEARAQSRPIGAGARYAPPAAQGPIRDCRRRLGPRIAMHFELFARDRVVIVPLGIGGRGARVGGGGRIDGARCYGPIVTLDPTGIVLVRPGRARTVGDLM